MVERAGRQNGELARVPAKSAGGGCDRPIAAGDENSPRPAVDGSAHARRELRWRNALDAERSRLVERFACIVSGAGLGVDDGQSLAGAHALRPASIASSSTVALRSSFPHPTTWPRIAAANDFTTTQYMICR